VQFLNAMCPTPSTIVQGRHKEKDTVKRVAKEAANDPVKVEMKRELSSSRSKGKEVSSKIEQKKLAEAAEAKEKKLAAKEQKKLVAAEKKKLAAAAKKFKKRPAAEAKKKNPRVAAKRKKLADDRPTSSSSSNMLGSIE
jgi:hypothetical protein